MTRQELKVEPGLSFMRCHRKLRNRTPAPRTVISLVALAFSLAFLITGAAALPVSQPVQPPDRVTLVAAERWSPATERSWITFHLDMPEKISIRQQHLHQEILAVLLADSASQLASVRPCDLNVQFLDGFGDFAIGAGHPNLARRLDCLRGVVGYLLRQTISEFDFNATRREEAYGRRLGYSGQIYAQQLALLNIYQKYSPLYQIHSTTPNDLSGVLFEEFDVWLRRSREQRLITFGGKTALLDSLDLPVPDPMVLRPIHSLKSPRVPAGVLFFESGRIEFPALIMVRLDPDDPNPVDRPIADRLSCNLGRAARLGAASAGSAISNVHCQISNWFGDLWLSLAVGKPDGASYPDFCRQVKELTGDADVAAAVRGSPEGSKGLYVLLPPECEAHE